MIHKYSSNKYPTKLYIHRGDILNDIKIICAAYFIKLEDIITKTDDKKIISKRNKVIKMVKLKGYSFLDIGRILNLTKWEVWDALKEVDEHRKK